MKGKFSVVTLTIAAAATVAANRFVLATGALPVAGGPALGVTRHAGVAGDLLPVDCVGTAIVQAAGVIAVGAACKVDATGQVLAWDLGSKVGMALSAAGAAGELIEILLIPNA